MTAGTQNIVMTRGISLKMENNLGFANHVQASLDRFHSNDWGDDIDPEAWKANDKSKDDPDSMGFYALGSYKTGLLEVSDTDTSPNVGWEKIWIIREHDGSVTTVLFPEEN